MLLAAVLGTLLALLLASEVMAEPPSLLPPKSLGVAARPSEDAMLLGDSATSWLRFIRCLRAEVRGMKEDEDVELSDLVDDEGRRVLKDLNDPERTRAVSCNDFVERDFDRVLRFLDEGFEPFELFVRSDAVDPVGVAVRNLTTGDLSGDEIGEGLGFGFGFGLGAGLPEGRKKEKPS